MMKLKAFFLLLIINLVRGDQCPAQFTPPDECFSLDDIKDYGPTSKHIETLYNHYVRLLTKADLIIDGNEVSESFEPWKAKIKLIFV